MKNTAFKTKLRETIYNVLKEKEEEEVEATEEESEEVDTEVSVSDEEEVEVDVEEEDTGVVLKLSPTIQGLQKDLQDAFAAAEQLGDTKLVTQIGNTITYFTRTHVVGTAEEVNESAKKRLTKKIFESLKKKFRLNEIELEGGGIATLKSIATKDFKLTDPKMQDAFTKLQKGLDIKEFSPQEMKQLTLFLQGMLANQQPLGKIVGAVKSAKVKKGGKGSKENPMKTKDVTSENTKYYEDDVKKLSEKAYPWNECMSDNEGKYGKEGAKRVCGSIKAQANESLLTFLREDKDWIQHAIKRPGALHRELGVPQDEDIPKWKMDSAEDRLEDEERRDHKAGRKMSAGDRRELRQIDLAKTLEKFTENKSSKKKSVKESLRKKRRNVRRK